MAKMLDHCYKRKIPTHYKELLEKLNIQRCCGDFCDVTVVIQRIRFRAHRCVLSAASKKLHSLVTSMKPIGSSSRKHGGLGEELKIQEVTVQGFKIILDFIYTGVLWIPGDCLNDVCSAAVYLEMEDVIKCCNGIRNGKESEVNAMSPSSVSEDEEGDDIDCVNDSASNAGGNNMTSSNKLPVLDSSLGGLLNNTTTNATSSSNLNHATSNCGNLSSNVGPSASSSYNLSNNLAEESAVNPDNQNKGSSYPDQDALSEISVQNEDEMMYQTPSSGRNANQTGSDYQYNNYIPSIEQTFSPRSMAKLMPSHMTILPGILPSQAFFQDQGQFPIDAYYVSQPGQYYASNYMQQQQQSQQDQGRGDYTGDNTSSQSYFSQGFSSSDSDRQRLVSDGYHSSSMLQVTNASYKQHSSSTATYSSTSAADYGNGSNAVCGDMNDLPVVSGVDREVQHIHNNAYTNQSISSKMNPTHELSSSNLKSHNKKERLSETKSSNEKLRIETSQRYTTISPVSCQETSDNPFIEAISPYNPDNEIPVPTLQTEMPAMNKAVETNFVQDSNTTVGVVCEKSKKSMDMRNDSHTSHSLKQVTSDSGNKSTHFSNRPAARMPPKKAGYRGIESDYNRHFNIFSDQYNDVAKISNLNDCSSKGFKSQDGNEHFNRSLQQDISTRSSKVQCNSPKNKLTASNQVNRANVGSNFLNSSVIKNEYKSTKVQNEQARYSGDLRASQNTSSSVVQSGHHNYSHQDGHSTNTHEIHIQTKKMAASQAAKAAVQANLDNCNNSHRTSLTGSTNKHSSSEASASKSLSSSSNLSSYSSLPDASMNQLGMPTGCQQIPRLPLPLETSNLYGNEPEAGDSSKAGNVGFTPIKNNKMIDLVDSIEDYLKFIDNGTDNTSPSKSSSYSHITPNTGNNCSQNTHTSSQQIGNSGLGASYSGNDMGLNNNGSDGSALGNNTSGSSYSFSSSGISSGSRHALGSNHSTNTGANSVSYSVEDVRKTILNVLSQECFDDDSASGLSSGSKGQGSMTYKKQDVSLTTLLKIAPFDKTRTAEASNTGPTQYADVSSSQENPDRFVTNSKSTRVTEPDVTVNHLSNSSSRPTRISEPPDVIVNHFEDIDSASDDDSNYNLVIDFDKEIHEEDVNYSTASKGIHDGKQGLSRNDNGKHGRGKAISKDGNTSKSPSEKIEKSNEMDSDEVCENKVSCAKRKQSITIPKYALTAEYCEDNEGRMGGRSSHRHTDEPMIVKPLKKRIKLKLKMKKMQEKKTVTRHMLQKQEPNRHIKYVCELCKREFYDKYKAYAEHMHDHNRKLLHFCNVCGMGYKRLEDLSKHRSTNHSLVSFQCKDCNELYNNVILYKKHCVTEHGNSKPFYCLFAGCSYAAERFNTLEKHVLIHGEEKQFTCPQCSTKFSQPNGLRAHLVSCMNMQTYACPLCSKTFNRNQGLKDHMLCHSATKSHTCNDCGASFNDVRNYKRHCRKHSSVPKFTCRHCDSKFNYSNVLKRHILKKHPDKEHVEFGKKGAKNKESVLIKNYIN